MRDTFETSAIGAALLEWYDTHARALPWRVGPAERRAGVEPDPYRVWLSEIMLQQTTVAAVKDYFHRFTRLWPTVGDLAAAEDGAVMGEWAGLGYYARARNLLKCARVVAAEHGGVFPRDHDTLLGLPGIGPYTAAAISAIAFDAPETVMDGNVERVVARLWDIHTPLPTAKPELYGLAEALTPQQRPGDHAQAMMDLGATICTPKNPACGICPLRAPCAARAAGTAPLLPKKAEKKPKPVRRGIAYIARRADGALLLERRPDKGLLGGMLGWPGSDWGERALDAPPIRAEWQVLPGEVRHTFTHFHLILEVRHATVAPGMLPERGAFLEHGEFRPSDLPTVMRKAYDLWRGGADGRGRNG
ncbi:A/G-specific adenine glycosylase [Seohaeicola zhoushanensis]|uniref:Adenine DNA glycosylase n=1 Tax=Seohaeicola zhoushanensis TaxID=1569283 RepID=A0A8J3M527_9RHOB|nr:A/G-specific adenine glycosylase [Seohaeicola zhoushanensis]GHF41534.1 A/G-specific adenine glycosylase [Seohaeicola zhoushanensis]